MYILTDVDHSEPFIPEPWDRKETSFLEFDPHSKKALNSSWRLARKA